MAMFAMSDLARATTSTVPAVLERGASQMGLSHADGIGGPRAQLGDAASLRRTTRSTRAAARTASSCSHTRMTRQFWAPSTKSVSLSRLRFAAIFARHHERLAFGRVP
jgi:hypothetical protein